MKNRKTIGAVERERERERESCNLREKITGEKLKNKKAITLIALIITIAVMLILVGVVVNIALGENRNNYKS